MPQPIGTTPSPSAPRRGRLTPEYAVAAAGTLAIWAAQVFRFEAPLRDALTEKGAEGAVLAYPWTYTVLGPLSGLADLWTFNSPRQHVAWGVFLIAAYWIARPFRPWQKAVLYYPLYILGIVAFLAWGALFPRPAAKIVLSDPEMIAVDFHSHTTYSHDGRRFPPFFTPERNAAWHERQGFGAAFVTDHNVFKGAEEAFLKTKDSEGFHALPGEELSLHDSHIIALGNEKLIESARYSAGLPGLRRFFEVSESSEGALSVLSLPEYWKHHWERLETFARWGVDGIELENAAPKSLAFPRSRKERVIALARKHDLFLVGVSDSHGWGSASYAWSLMRIPGHRGMNGAELKAALIGRLSEGGFDAVQVVTRRKAAPETLGGLIVEPAAGLWTLLRTLPPALSLSWTLWLWGACFVLRRIRRL